MQFGFKGLSLSRASPYKAWLLQEVGGYSNRRSTITISSAIIRIKAALKLVSNQKAID